MSDLSLELFETPQWLYDIEVKDIFSKIKGPALINIEGEKKPKLFVSVLLHGNEHTGFLAIQKLLNKYKTLNRRPPRDILLLLGNVEAAAQNQRHLDSQPDYNRIWLGEHTFPLVKKVRERVFQDGVFACIDIHNNTGRNPHYSCISKIRTEELHLATLFSRTVVYFIRPEQAQTVVFSNEAPSLTLECGLSSDEFGVNHAADYIDALLHMDHYPEKFVSSHDISLFESEARILIDQNIKVAFEYEDQDIKDAADVVFRKDLDQLNFVFQDVGNSIGFTKLRDLSWINILNLKGEKIDTSEYLEINEQKIVLKQQVVPSMFTLQKKIIHQDCLGYLMKSMDIDFKRLK